MKAEQCERSLKQLLENIIFLIVREQQLFKRCAFVYDLSGCSHKETVPDDRMSQKKFMRLGGCEIEGMSRLIFKTAMSIYQSKANLDEEIFLVKSLII